MGCEPVACPAWQRQGGNAPEGNGDHHGLEHGSPRNMGQIVNLPYFQSAGKVH
jgi:hypothetical protein